MGNFSSKDRDGPTVTHGDSFHTPPASPQSDMPPFLHHLPPTTPLSSLAAPVSPPPPIPVITSTVKKLKSTTATITTSSTPSTFSPDQKPHPPVSSSSVTAGLSISSVHNKPGATVVKEAPALGRNGGPRTSTPRTPGSKGKTVPVSPSKNPSAPVSASPLVGSSSSQNWRDSGLSQSLLPAHETGDSHAEEMRRLLEDCRTLLGITASHDGSTDTAEILRHFLIEVKNLKSTLETERGEWLQFQADLQVAVAVADRLRAETEEELTALQTVHKGVERELAAAHQRQKETDLQLVTLRGELKESRQRLATLNQAQGKTAAQVPCQEAEMPSKEATNTLDSKEGTQGGTDRVVHRLGLDGPEKSCEKDVTKNGVSEEVRSGYRDVTKRYLKNVTNEHRSVGEEARSTETRRTVTTERSRSLSRLPATSDSLTVQNGTSQCNTATTVVHTNMDGGQQRGRKSLDWQDSRPSTDIGKREETLNKYNSTLTELPPTNVPAVFGSKSKSLSSLNPVVRSQDGFNLLLRRHGGSKRNSLLRWCQSRTQGYKNIDITNFSSSWADGLAFCAVYHTYLPSHIPYSSLTPENKRDNLSVAFKTGETVGIAQTLTVEEMLRPGGPDWQRVLSYVESMYRHFEM